MIPCENVIFTKLRMAGLEQIRPFERGHSAYEIILMGFPLIEQVYSRVFDDEAWAAFRLLNRRANSIFKRYCQSPRFVLVTGDLLGLRVAPIVPELYKYPCTKKNHWIYAAFLCKLLDGCSAHDRVLYVSRCPTKNLMNEELMDAIGPLEEAYKALDSLQDLELYRMEDLRLLRYFAIKGHKGCAEALQRRGIRDWDIYRQHRLPFRCPSAYSGSHEEFARAHVEYVPFVQSDSGFCDHCARVLHSHIRKRDQVFIDLNNLLSDHADLMKYYIWMNAAERCYSRNDPVDLTGVRLDKEQLETLDFINKKSGLVKFTAL